MKIYIFLGFVVLITFLFITIFFEGERQIDEKEIEPKKIKRKTEREKLVDRLTDLEQRNTPHLSRKEARESAIYKWDRDNK